MQRKNTAISQLIVNRKTVCSFLSDTLSITSISDYSCNGLQVEGCHDIGKIGLAVDACMETYKMAVAASCQMLIVHHGIIWGGLTSVCGRQHEHISYLLHNDINLFAAHLPLDLHPEYGNNAQLARMLGLDNIKPFGIYKGTLIGYEGTSSPALSRDDLVAKLCTSLDTSCTVLPFGKESISSIGIVSGGGYDELAEAIEKGLDCFITGEPSHENYHAALEAKINVIYAGHYHTEKAGVLALGKLLETTFGVETVFLDCPTEI